jgi:restriction system protein
VIALSRTQNGSITGQYALGNDGAVNVAVPVVTMSEESLYEVLGVSETSSTETITAAYRRLVRLTHPDAGGNDFLFRRVHEAHATLSDTAKRDAYDRDRRRPPGITDEPETPENSGWTRVDDPPPGWTATDGPTDASSGVPWNHDSVPTPTPAIHTSWSGPIGFVASRPWTVLLVAALVLLRSAPTLGFLLFLLGLVAAIGSRRGARRQALRRANIGDVDAMDGIRFEHYVGEVLRGSGYRVNHVGKVGDFGADLVVDRGGRRSVVQTKRYSNSVGVSAVREAAAARAFYHADHAIVVTNSFFTGPAVQLARSNQVDLWDRHVLADLARRAEGQPKVSPVALLGSELAAGFSMLLAIFGAFALSSRTTRRRRSRRR